MGAPVLIGAGIGAAASLATGRNPLQGALLGGIGGGTFGGSAGLGSGFTEGGLFSLGSEAGKAGLTSTATSGATSGGAANFMQPTMPYQAGLDYPAQLSSQAMSSTSPVVGSGANIGANLNYVNSDMPQRFIDTSASQNLMTGTRAYQQGGLAGGETSSKDSLFTRAYEGLTSYAKENPLVAAQLGLAAFGGINPPQREVQVSGGQITKGTPPQGVGTPLRVRRPR